jgi:hypothetical protein
MSRAESKAMNREVPWGLIPKHERAAFVEAARKEWAEWLRWGAVRPATRGEKKNMIRANVMQIRSAHRWKSAVIGNQRRAKCRAVIQGFKDPHLHILPWDSPVLTRVGFHLILLVAISMDRSLSSSDCSSACLQCGAAPERPEMIFGRLPGIVFYSRPST